MNAFTDNPWFKSLAEEDKTALLQHAKPLFIPRNSVLFYKGDVLLPQQGCFFGLVSGTLKASTLHPNGKEAILMMVEAGNWFGEITPIDHLPRTHTVTAMTDAQLLTVDHIQFEQLLRSHTFAHAITRLLASRLRLVYGFIESIVLQDLPTRIGHLLEMLAKGGASQHDNHRPTIDISQESLAMMLGVSRQSLNKELQHWVQCGAISIHYGHITIENHDILTALSQNNLSQKTPKQ